MNILLQDIRYLKGVGEKRAQLFEKLGVSQVGALISFYPYRYIDYSVPYNVSAAPYDVACVVRATVLAKGPSIRTGGGKNMIKVVAGDESATLNITFFNNPYGANALEIGKDYLFYGKFSGSFTVREIVAPTFIRADGDTPLTPIYHLTDGLTSKYVANCVKNALAKMEPEDWQDPLPEAAVKRHRLSSHRWAIEHIHFPQNMQEVETARKRLIFEELLYLQLGLLSLRGRERKFAGIYMKPTNLAHFYQNLPFTPTGAQKRSAQEILGDMAGNEPMNRLLQGDVGSGKTLVAAAAIYNAAQNNYQSALMAPTEILAAQHAETLTKTLAPYNIGVALLTGSVKGKVRTAALAAIANGDVQVVVGTHAIISADVQFKNLGLVITDEQHRFGVRQRSALSAKGVHPHLLVMSATPIPRTLGLIIFGDLDISVLDEMPPGRTPVKTYHVGTDKRIRMFGFIAKHVAKGQQAYIICPVIEEGITDLQAVTTYYKEVAKPLLPHARIGLLHGRMKPKEKNEMMQQFKNGGIDVLCSTTVIEVGVDVPNASIMIIENAERFGLSALHQLRGRVGRGAAESFCILVSDHMGEAVRRRLSFLAHTSDGFAVAKYDLENRGPGDFFGNRQHGLPNLQIADLVTDAKTLEITQKEAAAIISEDPFLSLPQHQLLRSTVDRLFEQNSTLN